MGGWIKVDDLKPTAEVLALAAEALEDASSNAPTVPDAGSSTERVGQALTELFHSIGTVATSLADAADAVQESNSSYHGTDQNNASQFTHASTQPRIGPK